MFKRINIKIEKGFYNEKKNLEYNDELVVTKAINDSLNIAPVYSISRVNDIMFKKDMLLKDFNLLLLIEYSFMLMLKYNNYTEINMSERLTTFVLNGLQKSLDYNLTIKELCSKMSSLLAKYCVRPYKNNTTDTSVINNRTMLQNLATVEVKGNTLFIVFGDMEKWFNPYI